MARTDRTPSARPAPPSRAGKRAAIVIGIDSITGLQTARVLTSRGVPVVGLASNSRHPGCRTNVCDRILFGPTDGDGLIELLNQWQQSFAMPPVLFPCTDLSVLALSRGRAALSESYRMVLPRPEVLELLLDKGRFAEYATAANLPIAATRVLRTADDVEDAIKHLTFPCAVKPALKTVEWHRHTSAKVFKVQDGNDLRQVFRRCRGWAAALVVQQWIDGPDTAHFTCNAYFDADASPVLTFVSQKLRQWPLEGGVACFSQECQNETVRQETIRLFRGLHYHGLAYLEMKLDRRSGKYFIIEPNVGRPTGRSAAADAGGVELLYTQYCDAAGEALPPMQPQPHDGSRWVYFRQDCQASFALWRRGALSLGEWMGSWRGCRGDAVFAWHDPKPFVADIGYALRKVGPARLRGRADLPGATTAGPRTSAVPSPSHSTQAV